ncbi:MAG: peptidase S8, partial [Acidobacteriota bacterium]
QMWHEGVWPGHGGGGDVFESRPAMATSKALMINNAFRYDWANPGGCAFGDIDRDKQGWGTADVRKLYDRAEKTIVINETDVIAPLATLSYQADVIDGESELAVTMVYTDPMGTPGAAEARINDLSLRVTSPSSEVFWGNHGLADGNLSTAGGSSNTIDTVENVFIASPEAGIWTIEVIGDEIVQDAHLDTAEIDAVFALVIAGDRGSVLFRDGFESGSMSAWSNATP